MKRYAFIENGIVLSIIEGKVDGSRNWEDYYGDKRGMLCVAIPENEPVGIGFKYADGVFQNSVTELTEAEKLEQWRQTAVLTRRKFTLAYKRYTWGEGTLKQAIDSLLQTLLQSEIQAEVQMGEVMQESLAETTEFTRTHEDIIAMATAIGMTPEQVDTFYVFAENEEWRN